MTGDRGSFLFEEFDRAARATGPGGELTAALAAVSDDDQRAELLMALQLLALSDSDAARRYAGHLLGLADLLPEPHRRYLLAGIDVTLAELCTERGDWAEATMRLTRARADVAELLPDAIGDWSWVMASCAEHEGQPDEARRLWRCARDLFATDDRWFEAAQANAELAVLNDEGNPAGEDPVAQAISYWGEAADRYAAADEPESATACAVEAVHLARRILPTLDVGQEGRFYTLASSARDLAQRHGATNDAAEMACLARVTAPDTGRNLAEARRLLQEEAEATGSSRRVPSMDEQDDVATLCANIAVAVVGHGDLDSAIADFHRLPPDLPARGTLASGLLEALMRTDPMSDPRRLRALDGLLEIADVPQPPTPQWIRTRTAAQVMTLMRAVAESELTDPAEAIARLDALAREHGADPALKSLFGMADLMLRFTQSVQDDDAFALSRLPDDIRRFVEGMPQRNPQLQSLTDVLTAVAEVMAANQGGGEVTAGVHQMMLAARGLPPGNLRDVLEDGASTLAKLRGMFADGSDERLTDEQFAQLRARAEQPGLDDPERARRHTAAAVAALRGWQETDIGRIESGVTHLRQALKLGDPGDPKMRAFHLSGLALGLWRHSELTNSTADLRETRTLLEEARTLAGGPRHPQWQMLNEMLSGVRRMLGDSEDFHRTALEGLRARVWQVLAQQELAGATLAVRGAAAEAVETARTCLVANDPVGAISALDAGRGLALFAATEVRTIADRLEEAGDPELAQRWRTAAAAHDPAQLSPDLRRAVLTVLTAHSSAAALLDPPAFGEIQQALAAVDADALVYLVPGTGVITGYAVIAPASGPPSFMALPNLQVEGDPDLERYLATLARRDAAALGSSRALTARDLGPVGAAGDDAELAGSLDALCGGAWGAGMGALSESYLSRLPQPASGRPHRVVLVPMSDLARIPWQAARRNDGRYAIELIAISQAASARMLCRSAALSPVAPSPVGLLVGDPDTTEPTSGEAAAELGAARLEAYAIRQSFYRGARYVGRRPDGSASPSGEGTRHQVCDWLTASGPAAGAMLHLACHGFVQTGTDQPTAYLLLAGGQRLTAEELIALMARAPEREIGLVVLAACRTGLSINGYDEAYSLGTAFLAGGVRSVLSTQWSIPDRDTSVLMFMFHHFLRAGRTAWAALREAQLWMLAPDQVVPGEMPPPLRRQLDSTNTNLGAVVAWAAFVHWGQ